MAYPSKDMMAAIAVTRFGLGARPGELAEIGGDPQGWLNGQIRPQGADPIPGDMATSASRLIALAAYRQDRRALKARDKPKDDVVMAAVRMLRDDVGGDFIARAQLGATTPAGFRERWALFWCNHFTASATKLITAVVVGPFENEAIRPRVFGRFEDLLVASSAHPAMLSYLDQYQSVGPDSMGARFVAARQRKQPGLNENLAREIMELHTLGVDGGYAQADVTEFARAMTGWSIGGPRDPGDHLGKFVFRTATHEPGARTILGKHYAEGGFEQAQSVMRDLAAHPATARHICTKIARHFVADDPPPTLVSRLESAWKGSDGNLGVVANALITAPEAWDPSANKFKAPYEFLISSWRAIGGQPGSAEYLAPIMIGMGQKPFSAPSPKGWPDDAATWCAPDAIIKRMSWSQSFAGITAGERDTNRLAAEALGARLSPTSAKAVARAESRPEALALLLMSPEFQRR